MFLKAIVYMVKLSEGEICGFTDQSMANWEEVLVPVNQIRVTIVVEYSFSVAFHWKK